MARSIHNIGFNGTEIWAMSQIVYGTYHNTKRNSIGEVLNERYKVSGLSGPAKNWSRKDIDKVIEFLRKEGLIKIHVQSSEPVDNTPNIAYQITLTQKGVQLAIDRTFHDYFRKVASDEYEKELNIREKKSNIKMPVISLIISSIIAVYTLIAGNEADEKIIKLSNRVDSISLSLASARKRIDSLSLKPKLDSNKLRMLNNRVIDIRKFNKTMKLRR